MSAINYFGIIKRAWLTTWRHKYLWWFGMFVSLAGSGGYVNYANRNGDIRSAERQAITDFISKHLNLFLAVILVAAIILIIFLILSVIGRGALISGSGKSFAGTPSDYRQEFREGLKYFWRIFAVGFLVGLFVLAIIIILAIPLFFLFYSHSYLAGALLTLIALFIFIPLVIVSAFVRLYGYIYAVAGNMSFWEAIENAYLLFSRNIWKSILMGLFFIPINFVYFIALVSLVLPIVFIFTVIGAVLFLMLKATGIIISIASFLLVVIIAVLLLRSVYETFSQAVWLLFFHAIAKPLVPEVSTETVTEEESTAAPTPDPAMYSENKDI